jgi:hypothetical protein
MRNGIVFIWSEKKILGDIMDAMDQKDFHYIENFSIIYSSLNLINKELTLKDKKAQ